MCPTRRAVLGGGLALGGTLLLGGCGGHDHKQARPSPTPTRRSAALATAVMAERELLAAYAATLRRHPDLSAALAVPLDHHRAHLRALGAAPAATTGPTTAVPADARTAVQSLIALEQKVSAARVGQAIAAVADGSLLAALAAAEAVHADLLTAALVSVAPPASTKPPVESSGKPVSPHPQHSSSKPAAKPTRTATTPAPSTPAASSTRPHPPTSPTAPTSSAGPSTPPASAHS
ncbi:MAG TPA: hypothetical protein VHC41_08485 [Mycobacteriales bacterium]|nr:hypothetical protein [Mycobacteriales bacterium]